jgi:hypothetical protein
MKSNHIRPLDGLKTRTIWNGKMECSVRRTYHVVLKDGPDTSTICCKNASFHTVFHICPINNIYGYLQSAVCTAIQQGRQQYTADFVWHIKTPSPIECFSSPLVINNKGELKTEKCHQHSGSKSHCARRKSIQAANNSRQNVGSNR